MVGSANAVTGSNFRADRYRQTRDRSARNFVPVTVFARRRLLAVFFVTAPLACAAHLTPQTSTAFDRYIELTEAQRKADLSTEHFLRLSKVRGLVRVEPGVTLDNGKRIAVPDGMIQHWIGAMFIPDVTIPQVTAMLQDYANYKNFYNPEVIESKQISHQGDEYDVFLRLYKKRILTVVLNTNYHVRYGMVDSHRTYLISRSTRIAELKDGTELPVGDDTGFLWRLNTYWRFEQADGGVYAECEAISLSRDVPGFLSWMIKGFVEKFPKESMLNTLRGTKSAVLGRGY
jgi:hypothetical protein